MDLKGVRRVLYRLPELLAALEENPKRWVLLPEGEKDADRLRSLEFVATSVAGGSSAPWVDDYSETLRGRNVAILVDRDDPGWKRALKVARALHGVASTVKIIDFEDLGPRLEKHGPDVSDWLDQGHTAEELSQHITAAPAWKPADDASETEETELEKPAGPVLRVKCMRDVIAKPVDWLWERWLARGKVTIIGGHGGEGKGTLTTWLAAELSHGGTWPDGTPAPKGRTLFLIAEDGVEDTLKPRLALHGADDSQVSVVEAVREPTGKDIAFSIARHLDLLEGRIIADRIDLLVIDPISSFMPNADRNSEGAVRDLLTPLTALADRTGVAIICVLHLTKPNGTNRRPVQQLLGSTAFGAIARTVWMVAAISNEPDETHRVLAVVKSNLAIKPLALEWSRELDQPIKWHGETEHDISELLGGGTPSRPRDDAEGFLRELLADGPRLSESVTAAATSQGFSDSTLRRASKDIGILKRKGKGAAHAQWWWALPEHEDKLFTLKDGEQLAGDGAQTQLAHALTQKVSKLSNLGESGDPIPENPRHDGKMLTANERERVEGVTQLAQLAHLDNIGVSKLESARCADCGEPSTTHRCDQCARKATPVRGRGRR